MFKNYLTEIITKQDWRYKGGEIDPQDEGIYTSDDEPKEPYRKKVLHTIDFKEYKDSLKTLKNIFKKLNSGVFKSTLIFDYQKITGKQLKLSTTDKHLINILKALDYTISDESYMLGFVQKNNKSIMVNDIMNGLDSKNKENMQKAYEKTKNPAIKKQLDVLDQYEDDVKHNKEKVIGYKIAQESKLKIVMSIQPRLIASQSTEVGWRSCMNLVDGEYNSFVGKGISHGVIIVFVVRTGDEHALESPMARVLLKPLKDSKGNVVYMHDKVYGTAPAGFLEKVKTILEQTGHYIYGKETAPGKYVMDADKLYLDDPVHDALGAENNINVLAANEKELAKQIEVMSDEEKKDILNTKEVLDASDHFKEHLISAGIVSPDKMSLEFLKSFKDMSDDFYEKMAINDYPNHDGSDEELISKLFTDYTEYLVKNNKLDAGKLVTALNHHGEGNFLDNLNKLFELKYKFTDQDAIQVLLKINIPYDFNASKAYIEPLKKLIKIIGNDPKDYIEPIKENDSTFSRLTSKIFPKQLLFNILKVGINTLNGNRIFNITDELAPIQMKKILLDLITKQEKSIFKKLVVGNSAFISRCQDLISAKKIKLTEEQKEEFEYIYDHEDFKENMYDM